MDYFDVIAGIKNRPGMYISPENLTSLMNFTQGYFHCKTITDTSFSEREKELQKFYSWIAGHYGVSLVVGDEWAQAIKSQAKTGEEEIEIFLQLWGEYFNNVVKRS